MLSIRRPWNGSLMGGSRRVRSQLQQEKHISGSHYTIDYVAITAFQNLPRSLFPYSSPHPLPNSNSLTLQVPVRLHLHLSNPSLPPVAWDSSPPAPAPKRRCPARPRARSAAAPRRGPAAAGPGAAFIGAGAPVTRFRGSAGESPRKDEKMRFLRL